MDCVTRGDFLCSLLCNPKIAKSVSSERRAAYGNSCFAIARVPNIASFRRLFDVCYFRLS